MIGRRRLEDEEHESHERWLVSYADMITLLAALFIVLFAMSSLDLKKFQSFAEGVRASFGGSPVGSGSSVLDGDSGEGVLDTPGPPTTTAAQAAEVQQEAFAAARRQIETALADAGLGGSVRFRTDARGLVLSVVSDEVLFDTGSSALRVEGGGILDALAPALARLPNEISVDGHTDDRPVRSGGSNWELSTARATAVLRYLVERRGLDPSRIVASGYADQRPLVPNDTEEHRAVNRRVELVVLADLRAGSAVAADDRTEAAR
jgi:chemotaxis protein MotB